MRGGNSYLKYWLLAASLGLAVGSLQLTGLLDPLVIFNRLSVVVMSDAFTIGSLAFGVYLSFSFLIVVLLALELWKPRFWCRHLCPQGALLALFSPLTLLNRKVSPACNNCTLCYRVCPMHAIPADELPRDQPRPTAPCAWSASRSAPRRPSRSAWATCGGRARAARPAPAPAGGQAPR